MTLWFSFVPRLHPFSLSCGPLSSLYSTILLHCTRILCSSAAKTSAREKTTMEMAIVPSEELECVISRYKREEIKDAEFLLFFHLIFFFFLIFCSYRIDLYKCLVHICRVLAGRNSFHCLNKRRNIYTMDFN